MIQFTDSLAYYKFNIGSSSGTVQQQPKADGATSESTQNLGMELYIECCICNLHD